MKVSIRHDINIRKHIDAIRKEWVLNKSIYNDKSVSSNARKDAHIALKAIFELKGSQSMLVNYCVRTGESRSVIRKFVRNRHLVRDIAIRGKLPGVMKASW